MKSQKERNKIAESMCKSAQELYYAVGILNKEIIENGIIDVAIPSSINASLSIEIYLKALIFLEKDLQIKNSHDLKELWDELSIDTQKNCSINYQKSIQSDHFHYVEKGAILEKIPVKEFPKNLAEVLESSRKCFELNRYIYEGKGSSFLYYSHVRFAIIEEIKKHIKIK